MWCHAIFGGRPDAPPVEGSSQQVPRSLLLPKHGGWQQASASRRTGPTPPLPLGRQPPRPRSTAASLPSHLFFHCSSTTASGSHWRSPLVPAARSPQHRDPPQQRGLSDSVSLLPPGFRHQCNKVRREERRGQGWLVKTQVTYCVRYKIKLRLFFSSTLTVVSSLSVFVPSIPFSPINDIHLNSDSGKISVLVLLDLSAAFDAVDHNILLQRLENWVWLSGMVHKWFRSYLEGRGYYVSIGEHKSQWTSMTCGVPQGSIFAPLLFSLYILPLGQIMRKIKIAYHSYADDTQIYLALSPNDYSPIDSLCQCIDGINSWMCQNFLRLNKEKT